jgi:putative protein kinase ArgK-like GTPase of G3E family
VASARTGLDAVLDALHRHRQFLEETGRFQDRRRRQAEALVRQALDDLVRTRLAQLRPEPAWTDYIDQLLAGQIDPAAVAQWVWSGLAGGA